jgi:hypothetical protein
MQPTRLTRLARSGWLSCALEETVSEVTADIENEGDELMRDGPFYCHGTTPALYSWAMLYRTNQASDSY